MIRFAGWAGATGGLQVLCFVDSFSPAQVCGVQVHLFGPEEEEASQNAAVAFLTVIAVAYMKDEIQPSELYPARDQLLRDRGIRKKRQRVAKKPAAAAAAATAAAKAAPTAPEGEVASADASSAVPSGEAVVDAHPGGEAGLEEAGDEAGLDEAEEEEEEEEEPIAKRPAAPLPPATEQPGFSEHGKQKIKK